MDLGNIQHKNLLKKQEKSGKSGRPSTKNPSISYKKVAIELPVSTLAQMKQALLIKFNGIYKTQSELINQAILEFLKTDK